MESHLVMNWNRVTLAGVLNVLRVRLITSSLMWCGVWWFFCMGFWGVVLVLLRDYSI